MRTWKFGFFTKTHKYRVFFLTFEIKENMIIFVLEDDSNISKKIFYIFCFFKSSNP